MFKRLRKYFSYKGIFPLSKEIVVSADFSIGVYRNIQVNPKSRLHISGGIIFREFCNILLYENGYLHIGKNVFFNNYCSLNCLIHIQIGDNSIFGEGVKIYDHNHEYNILQTGVTIERDKFKTEPVKIGKNCWIGSNVTILKGVEIGDNVIIGAGNLIYKSVPSNTIVKLKTEALQKSL